MKSLFFKWLATFFVLAIGALCFFLPQLEEIGSIWVHGVGADGAGEATLDDADLAMIRSVRFVAESDGIAPASSLTRSAVAVSDLREIGRSGSSVTVGLRLTATPAVTAFPSLRIYLQAQGKTVRTLDFSPDQYAHGLQLLDEQVYLSLNLMPVETGFTAQAFYPSGGHPQ